jgi:hypothetical protein
MPKDTTITSIIASGNIRQRWRVLSIELDWPAGDPPYVNGDYITLPAIPTSPDVYDPETFDAYAWTDISHLVSDYHYSCDSTMPIGQLSMTVPLEWRQDLGAVFREMRVILVQERYSDGTHTTTWKNRCWCLSDGFNESWVGGMLHSYVVNAKDVLKLANIENIGARTGSLVLQADLVHIGTFASKASLVLVNTATDAYEYAITSDGTAVGAIHPNWSDRPGPQFWVTNARDKDGTLVTEPVSISGDGVQAVFGSGILRIGKNYANTTSASGGATNFSVGLGIPAGTAPIVVGVLSRFAHPADPTVTPALPADVVDSLTVATSGAGTVTLSAPVTSVGLTLVMRDGTGRRFQTVPSATPGTPTATLTLTNSTIIIAPGAAVSYGDANRLRDVIVRLLLPCGYQMADAAAPLYLHMPEVPLIAGQARDIILPPQVYLDSEKIKHIGAIARLREEGYIPPNYIVYATDTGQVRARSVTQAALNDAATIPITAIPINPGLQNERSDIAIVTRMVARGIARQVQDATQSTGTTIADVASTDGGLPDPATYTYNGLALSGKAVRGTPSGLDYQLTLAPLLDRGRAPSVDITSLAPWAWYIRYYKTWSIDITQAINDWSDRALCEITLPDATLIDAIDIHAFNTWTAVWGWGQTDRRGSHNGGQAIGIDYYDAAQTAWLPLVTYAYTPAEANATLRITKEQFDSRVAVTAQRFRIICRRAFCGYNRSRDEWYDHFVMCVWLSQIKFWGSSELRGIAELGSADNYNGELASQAWQDIRTRLRSRTDILPDAVPWVDTQTYADWLALEWLKERCKDLAPRRLAVIRPDVRLWDTVAFTDPLGNEAAYLVLNTDHTSATTAQTGLLATNYDAPYLEA